MKDFFYFILRIIHSLDKLTAWQCLQDVLSDLFGSDAVDDRVETAQEQQVHGAEENPNSCRKIISDPIREESNKCNGQADGDDHDVGDAGVKCFDPRPSRTQHRAEYDHIGTSDKDKVSHSDEEDS